ncbi:LAFA_0G17084g1_1 [Lachancea sp. 'fantastica']|nr:LAFA_0G17084g1_1 [Lachancea sp. 'fantastica']
MSCDKKNAPRDVFGRDLSYLLACHPANEQLGKIDLYSHDMESGYTPLHVCLRLAYLQKAFKLYRLWRKQHQAHYKPFVEDIWDLKDREGLTPIELYRCENDIWNCSHVPISIQQDAHLDKSQERSSSMVEWRPRNQKNKFSYKSCAPSVQELRDVYVHSRGGRELFTTGTNVNLQLGTGDSEDRKELFKFDEYSLTDFQSPYLSPRFKAVIMKRYHSLILTMDGQILVAGTGTRGRLGNGNTSISNVSHTKIDLDHHRVLQLDCSDHHSIVLTTSGEVFTWGWNRYSQLGYSTSLNGKNSDKSALENICSASPKKIANTPWKKTPSSELKFVACSKVHSCVMDTDYNLFVWGLNLGQMGATSNYTEEDTVSYSGYKGCVIRSPLRIKLPHFIRDVKQLFCTDFATFILWADNQLCVLNNYKVLNFSLPKTASKQNSSNELDLFTPNSLSKKSRVVKLKTANPHGNNLCVLYESGAVGILSSNHLKTSAHGWSKLPNSLPINTYWTPYYGWNKCLDFDVGVDGQLVLCTTGGKIYRSQSPSSPQFEMLKSKKLTSGKVIFISCDSLFSSFGVVKDDVDMIPIGYIKQNIYNNMASYSPLSTNHRHRRTTQNYELEDDYTTPLMFDNFLKGFNIAKTGSALFSHDRDDDNTNEFLKRDNLWSTLNRRWGKHKRLDYADQLMALRNDLYSQTRLNFIDSRGFDTLFVEKSTGAVVGGCHRGLLQARAPAFVSKLAELGSSTSKNGSSFSFRLLDDFNFDAPIRIEVMFEHHTYEAISYALNYMYTDNVPDTSHIANAQDRKLLDSSIKALMKELDLHLNTFRGDKLPFSLAKLFECSIKLESASLLIKPDVRLLLADGAILEAYSFILIARSAYFESILSRDWNGQHCGMKEVAMKYHTTDEMMCVLKYIYALPFADLFSHCTFADYKSFVDFVLGLIQFTGKLMMSDLRSYLESVLVDFIDASTVLVILVNAHHLFCKALIFECCWYLHNNIELLFTEKNSDFIENYFGPELWRIVQEFVIEARKVNRQTYDAWYNERMGASSLLSLFQENRTKYNEHFMDLQNPFEPSFDARKPVKKQTGSKKGTDRRKSSGDRKPSLSLEDLVNVRRPSTSLPNVNKPKPVALDYRLMDGGEEAVEDDISDVANQGFVTVGKSKRKASKSQNDVRPFPSILQGGSSKPFSNDSTTNVARFEAQTKFEKRSETAVPQTIPRLTTDRSSMFPALGNSLQGASSAESSSKLNATNFSGVKKLSQKERLKLAAQEASQELPPVKKAVWGSNIEKTKSEPAQLPNSSASKFPSLAQSLKGQSSKKKVPTVSLTSTGEGSTIPLYLSNTKINNSIPSRSLKDTIEEERFAKWWAEESEKVQLQLEGNQELISRSFKSTDSGGNDARSSTKKSHGHKKGHNRSRRPLNKRQSETKAST